MITLKTLDQATAQEVFDQVKNHLLTQNEKCTRIGSNPCLYRFGGLKCAGGCLISEGEYRKEFEGKLWVDLVFTRSVPTVSHIELISELQQVHDKNVVGKWPEKLKEVANNYGLKYE